MIIWYFTTKRENDNLLTSKMHLFIERSKFITLSGGENMNFTIFSKPHLIFGENSIYSLPTEMKNRGLKRAFLVVTPHFVNNGLASKIQDKLSEEGIDSVVYSNLIQDAPDFTINEGAQIARDFKADTVVAIGGGKAMDTAKSINIIINNPGKTIADFISPESMADRIPGVFLILCPTTTGTGSEMTYCGVVHFIDLDRKISVGNGDTFADLAIVDPVLTVELPPDITAETGLDALTHCVGCITSIYNVNPLSEAIAYDAIGIIMKNLPRAIACPTDMEARNMMSYASMAAGMAFIDQCCNVDHALSQSMGAAAGTPHGIACGAALPWAVKYLCAAAPEKVKKVARAMGVDVSGLDPVTAGNTVADALAAFVKSVGCPSMKDLNYTEEQLERIAELTPMDVVSYLCPRRVTREEILDLLHEAVK